MSPLSIAAYVLLSSRSRGRGTHLKSQVRHYLIVMDHVWLERLVAGACHFRASCCLARQVGGRSVGYRRLRWSGPHETVRP
jgi:hypothetical protein